LAANYAVDTHVLIVCDDTSTDICAGISIIHIMCCLTPTAPQDASNHVPPATLLDTERVREMLRRVTTVGAADILPQHVAEQAVAIAERAAPAITGVGTVSVDSIMGAVYAAAAAVSCKGGDAAGKSGDVLGIGQGGGGAGVSDGGSGGGGGDDHGGSGGGSVNNGGGGGGGSDDGGSGDDGVNDGGGSGDDGVNNGGGSGGDNDGQLDVWRGISKASPTMWKAEVVVPSDKCRYGAHL
jgi:hypothetical protein